MEKKTMPCKACGKPFVPCQTVLTESFNYKTVACSPECGKEYFRLIEKSRSPKVKTSEVKKTDEVVDKTQDFTTDTYSKGKKKNRYKKESMNLVDEDENKVD